MIFKRFAVCPQPFLKVHQRPPASGRSADAEGVQHETRQRTNPLTPHPESVSLRQEEAGEHRREQHNPSPEGTTPEEPLSSCQCCGTSTGCRTLRVEKVVSGEGTSAPSPGQ